MRLSFCLAAFAAAVCLRAQVNYRVDLFAGQPIKLGDGALASGALLNQPGALASDAAGNIYVADNAHRRIRKIDPQGRITTVTGTGIAGLPAASGPAAESRIRTVNGMAVDRLSQLYFTDSESCTVQRVTAAGQIERLAGTGICGFAGDGAIALEARINGPHGIAIAQDNAVWFADRNNHRIRRIDMISRTITNIAGNGTVGLVLDEGSPGATVAIPFPESIAIDQLGNVYYNDATTRVRRIAPDFFVWNVAGAGVAGNSGDGQQPKLALFRSVGALAFDATSRNLYISDTSSHRVRVVNFASDTIRHFAGLPSAGGAAFRGDGDAATSAALAEPAGVTVLPNGDVVISDRRNDRIRLVQASDGRIRTIAGRWRQVVEDGPATEAELASWPAAVEPLSDSKGNIYLYDPRMLVLWRVDTEGKISRAAGRSIANTPAGAFYGSGVSTGNALNSGFTENVHGLAIDGADRLYINDNRAVRLLDNGNFFNTVALPAGSTRLAFDRVRNRLYAANPSRHAVYMIDYTQSAPTARVFVGVEGSGGFGGDGGMAASARLSTPRDVAVDLEGNLYIADTGNGRVRRVTAAGAISTIAGDGSQLEPRQNLSPRANASGAPLLGPFGVAADTTNNLLLAEGELDLLRYLNISQNSLESLPLPAERPHNFVLVRADRRGHAFASIADGRVLWLRNLSGAAMKLLSGGGQSAAAGTRLPLPIVVRVEDGAGNPLRGVPLHLRADLGASPVAAIVTTSVDGSASFLLDLGPMAGTVRCVISSPGFAELTVNATATPSAAQNPNRPAVRSAAIASAFGGADIVSSGNWIEIFGSNLSRVTRGWTEADFQVGRAPAALEGVSVDIGGIPAFVAFVSPNQVNVQAPDGLPAGQASLVVRNREGASDPISIGTSPVAPYFLAPSSFAAGGVSYAAALHLDGAFVGRENLIAGAAFRPARPGDTIILYGIGFGSTTPRIPAGQVTPAPASLPGLAVRLGDAIANLLYAGLAPGIVGLYQFNLVVPEIPDGDARLNATLNGVPLGQILSLTIGRR